MRAKNYTANSLSTRLGYATSYISLAVRGHIVPSATRQREIANALGQTPESLFQPMLSEKSPPAYVDPTPRLQLLRQEYTCNPDMHLREQEHREDLVDLVQLSFAQLPWRHQYLLNQHYQCGKSCTAIGKGMGLTKQAVHARLRNARHSLHCMVLDINSDYHRPLDLPRASAIVERAKKLA